MKILKIVLMVVLLLGVASVFAGAVSAADQTNNPVIVKEENADVGAAPQTTGEIESENVSKIDLNAAAKPETTVNVENSTTSEPINSEVTDVTHVQNVSTAIGKEENSSDLQSGNSRELTIEEMKSIKGKDWINDAQRFANGVIVPVANAVLPGGSFHLEGFGLRIDLKFHT
jgi:cytoskeletal protein RodZ